MSKKHKIEAWAWLSYDDRDGPVELLAYGNGAQFQFPIFNTRQEALNWKKSGCGTPGMLYRIVKVTIQEQ